MGVIRKETSIRALREKEQEQADKDKLLAEQTEQLAALEELVIDQAYQLALLKLGVI